jgi:two-component system, NtrC family, nitrogen regulation response regulator NtrX
VIVGVSPAIRRAVALAERYARTRLAVLVVGATGTGKELVARYLHERSGRPGLFVDVNCCALPRDMVESLLFGHRRGAFTGAVESAVGHVERSDGGTLFLDELTGLALEAQGKLLRVLETGEVQPLGAGTKRRVDLRVVSAAQDDVGSALDGARFRRDLYQRVAGVVIELPPLVERREDVVPIAEYFAGASGKTLEPGVRSVLEHHSWPGNVRELRFVIERASCVTKNGTLSPAAVAEAIALGRETPSDHRSSLEDIVAAGLATGWNAARMAAALRIHRATLFRWLSHDGLTLRSLKESHESRDGRATGAIFGVGAVL